MKTLLVNKSCVETHHVWNTLGEQYSSKLLTMMSHSIYTMFGIDSGYEGVSEENQPDLELEIDAIPDHELENMFRFDICQENKDDDKKSTVCLSNAQHDATAVSMNEILYQDKTWIKTKDIVLTDKDTTMTKVNNFIDLNDDSHDSDDDNNNNENVIMIDSSSIHSTESKTSESNGNTVDEICNFKPKDDWITTFSNSPLKRMMLVLFCYIYWKDEMFLILLNIIKHSLA